MGVALWFFAGLATIAFSYNMRFTQATLSLGQEISGVNSGTGLQDAITPPWQTNFAILSYIAVLAAVILIWWQSGWLSGIGSVAIVLFGGGIVGAMLPEKDAPHFRYLIRQSMHSRYADYVRDGDTMRADAMKDLLIRIGVE